MNNNDYPLAMPEAALYGRLGDITRTMESPLGPAYTALLTVYSGLGINLSQVEPNPRPTLYALILAASTVGKSLVCKRAIRALHCPLDSVEQTMPVSDRGLYNLLRQGLDRKEEPTSIRPVNLFVDEGLAMFKKMAIEGSTLQGAFNKLWEYDRAGGSDKAGCFKVWARMSLLTNLTVESREEFRAKLPGDLSDGFISRVLIAPMPPEWYWDHAWVPSPYPAKNPMSGWDSDAPDTTLTTDPLVPRRPVTFPRERHQEIAAWSEARSKMGIPDRRWGQFAATVAVISASANDEVEVSAACLRSALAFVEWQASVHNYYSPSMAQNPSAVVADQIMSLMETAFEEDAEGKAPKVGSVPIIKGGWLYMAALNKKHNLSKKYGDLVTRAINSLKQSGLIEELVIEEKGQRPVATNRWRLVDWSPASPTVDIPTSAAEPA